MLADLTSFDVGTEHAAALRADVLARSPRPVGNHLFYIQTVIRRMADAGRLAELLPAELVPAYEARTGRPARPRKPPSPTPSKRPVAVELPDDFAPNDAMRRWAASTFPAVDVNHETAQFISHQRAKANRNVSWPDAWMKWIGQANKYAAQNAARRPTTSASTDLATGSRSPGRVATAADRRLASNLDAVAWAAEQDRLEAEQKGHRL